MDNPFVYGGAVTGEAFTDREKEIEELNRDLKSGESVFIISPRRYGKTSLILNVLSQMKSKNIYTLYIDLYKATSLQKLLELYVREIAKAVESRVEKMFQFLKETLPGLRPSISLKPDGSASIGIDYIPEASNAMKFLDEIYDLPQEIAVRKKKQFIIAFDEFQEITSFNGATIEKAMRASFQHHNKVSYLFAGSKKKMLYDMVSDPDRAFYIMGRIMNLSKLPREKFASFLLDAFKRTGYNIERGTIEAILTQVEEFPYNAQLLCHRLWDDHCERRTIALSDLEPALERIITEYMPIYISIWDNLTLPQRQVLQALARTTDNRPFTQEFIVKHQLGGASSVQGSINLLVKKQILDKENGSFGFTDVFFKEWIKRKM